MMDQIAHLLHATPFVPFTVMTTSGESFRVPHPDHALVSPKGTRVTIYDDRDTAAMLTALHIVGIKTGRGSSAKSRS